MDRRFALRSLLLSTVAWIGWRSAGPVAAAPPEKDKKEPKDPANQADDDEIPLDKVPANIRKAADAAVPKAKWEAAYKYEEEGKLYYDLEGRNSKGRAVVVTLAKDGEVESVETEIPVRELPEVVRQAVKAKWPRFNTKAAYEVREGDKVVGYDLEGKRPSDRHEIAIFASADGKELEMDESE